MEEVELLCNRVVGVDQRSSWGWRRCSTRSSASICS